MRGEIDRYHADRGFGFIRAGDVKDGMRYFFHVTDCSAPLRDRIAIGLAVSFVPQTDSKRAAGA